MERKWLRVVFSHECLPDGVCPLCGEEYSECPHPGPTQDGYEYRSIGGLMFGRPKPSLKLLALATSIRQSTCSMDDVMKTVDAAVGWARLVEESEESPSAARAMSEMVARAKLYCEASTLSGTAVSCLPQLAALLSDIMSYVEELDD